MNINAVTLSGNLTRDPELKAIPSGKLILRFAMAFNDWQLDKQTGEWKEIPNYINCVVWGNYADSLSRRLKKGTHVCVSGKLHWFKYTDKQGIERVNYEVNTSQVDVWVQPQTQPAQQATYPAPAPYPQPAQHLQQQQMDDLADSDIPF